MEKTAIEKSAVDERICFFNAFMRAMIGAKFGILFHRKNLFFLKVRTVFIGRNGDKVRNFFPLEICLTAFLPMKPALHHSCWKWKNKHLHENFLGIIRDCNRTGKL